MLLDIITVTKDDLEGVVNTIRSTGGLRMTDGIRQIIVDSSGEGIREKVKEIACAEINVDYVRQVPSGIAPAFNEGLSLSRAQWIWFLNGRDEVHHDVEPDKLMYLLRSSKADAVIFEIENMQSRIRSKHPPMWALWPPALFWIPHPATIVRREMFRKYGGFDERYKIAMDGEIWFRFFSKDVTVDMLSFPIALYDEGGMSRVQKESTAKEGIKIIKANLWMLLKKWIANGKITYDAIRHFTKQSKYGN